MYAEIIELLNKKGGIPVFSDQYTYADFLADWPAPDRVESGFISWQWLDARELDLRRNMWNHNFAYTAFLTAMANVEYFVSENDAAVIEELGFRDCDGCCHFDSRLSLESLLDAAGLESNLDDYNRAKTEILNRAYNCACA